MKNMLSGKIQTRQIMTAITILLLLFFPLKVRAIDLNSSCYTSGNPYYNSGYGGQCTAFAWGRACESTGTSLQFNIQAYPSAKYWYIYEPIESLSLTVGTVVQSNSIAVWEGDSVNEYGHVAYVERVEAGYVYFNEANVDTYCGNNCNWWGGGYDGYEKSLTISQFEHRGTGIGTILGYIYLDENSTPSTGRVDVSDGVDITPSTVKVGENYEISFDLKEFQDGYKYFYGVEVWLQDSAGNDIRRIKKWFDSDDTDFSPNETKSYTVSGDSDAPVDSEGWYQIAIKGRVGAEGEDRFTFDIVSGSGGVNPKSFYAEAGSISHFPEGYFDSATCDSFSGWTKDPDTTAPIDVHFYADGPSGTGTFIGGTSANIYRGDLLYSDKNHGFSFPAPESLKDGQTHQIYVYALDDQGGTNPLLTNSPQSIQCAPVNQVPVGYFESASCNALVGWTKDPDTTTAIDVHFYADGPSGTGTFIGGTSADIYRGDLLYDDKDHGFSFALPDSLNDGVGHQVYAYALDSNGGENPLLTNSPKTVQCGLTADQLAAVMSVIENVILADDDEEEPSKGWLPAILKLLLLNKE